MPPSTYLLVFNYIFIIFNIIKPLFTIAMVTNLTISDYVIVLFLSPKISQFPVLSVKLAKDIFNKTNK